MSHDSTIAPTEVPLRRVGSFKPDLLQTENHGLCPGCGHPIGVRIILEVLQEMNLANRSICILGHGCYGTFQSKLDIESILSLHGRSPAVATGMKRMRPDCAIFTLQGDGDMVSEGLAEVMHTAARGESVTCFLLNNGVFGDTGGQMTATTVVGQRTKNTLEGRNPTYHGHPIPIAEIVARMPGVAYVARGSVHAAPDTVRTRRYVRKAFEHQMQGNGFTLVEMLTMCPTGWFVPTPQGPNYLNETLQKVYPLGELRDIRAEKNGTPLHR